VEKIISTEKSEKREKFQPFKHLFSIFFNEAKNFLALDVA